MPRICCGEKENKEKFDHSWQNWSLGNNLVPYDDMQGMDMKNWFELVITRVQKLASHPKLSWLTNVDSFKVSTVPQTDDLVMIYNAESLLSHKLLQAVPGDGELCFSVG